MVCKISGNNKRDLSFVWRFIGYVMYGPWEDHFNRHETAFYQLVAPHLKDTSFRYPKVYFAGKYLQKICFLKYVPYSFMIFFVQKNGVSKKISTYFVSHELKSAQTFFLLKNSAN